MADLNTESIYRTSPTRTFKMLIIMLGLCAVGALIFFSMWDFWISQPPYASITSITTTPPATITGNEISVQLSFIESSDFRTLAFNALPGENGHNPDISANVGDKILFDVSNNGKSFHAFAVTSAPEGFNDGISNESKIGSSSNPLKPNESGSSFFIPSEEITYYYICTVPGHREQGMEGSILVSSQLDIEQQPMEEPILVPLQLDIEQQPITPIVDTTHEFSISFIESSDFRTLAFNALPGENGHNPELKVKSGDIITIKSINNGKSFHAFGITKDPEDFNNIIWDSAIASSSNPLKPGESSQTTFTAGEPGTYYYICTVPGHAIQGMQGTFIVE